MENLDVVVEQAHLVTLAKTPRVALAELVWNAIDADATNIALDVEFGALGGPEKITVIDNGTGIAPDDRKQTFGALGHSWKRLTQQSLGGRALHGKRGEGRWAALGIGDSVRWTSVAESTADGRVRFTISANKAELKRFAVSDLSPALDAETGVTVEIAALSQRGAAYAESDAVVEDLLTTFALHIEQYGLDLSWRRQHLDVEALKKDQVDIPVLVEGVDGSITLTVIEWKSAVQRHLYLCDAAGNSLHDMKPGIQAPGYHFTGYVKWAGFAADADLLTLEDGAPEPIKSVLDATREALKTHFASKEEERSAKLIKQWRDEDSYPFRKPPKNKIEEAARGIFDIVAVAAAPVVEKSDFASRKFSLELLKNAVETSPSSIRHILEEVLNLPPEQANELSDLIKKTSLGALLRAGNQVLGRLEFLTGLEQIINDRQLKKLVTERRQLHRILAEETWVFREEYALTVDDNTLRTALRSHTGLLGRDDLTPGDLDEPVVDSDGRVIVVDMMLSRVIEQSRNHREHIVIELKRPSVSIGKHQLDQIENYAQTVASDNRFAAVQTTWEFWIVGDEIDPRIKHKFGQGNLPEDVYQDYSEDGRRVTIRAVTWARIIQDARHRMKFVKDALGYDPDSEASINYLRERHGKVLPSVFMPKASANDENEGAFSV
ncbi:hypothetical protein B7R54_17105 [Subtercola boreus]|uniref:ATP-binding protein n=1 Tax=Subtercola boreus TaxID=120213 RepID=A0A3E0VLY6_9MICO|nr:ATP-binding protein [Subtercola boreus]RFA10731.1 hypothetical protein B7R54_17105 [Subtercola boreus]TQL55702.1 histidine kinase/DNA gyrase B/HSP90-like ATPase [Subtercola boreus]